METYALTNYYEIYDKVFKNPGYANTFRGQVGYKKLQQFLDIANFKSILDIGAGRGEAAKVIKEKYPDCEVTSIDLKDYRNSINKQYSNFLAINLMDPIISLPIVEAIICLGVLEHVEETHLNKILSTFSRVTKHMLLTVAINSDKTSGRELHVTQKSMEYWEELVLNWFEITYSEQIGKLVIFQGVTK